MPYTDQDLTDIETAIRKLQSGERVASVSYDGKTVSYSQVQLGELISLRDRIRQEVKSTTGTKTQISTHLPRIGDQKCVIVMGIKGSHHYMRLTSLGNKHILNKASSPQNSIRRSSCQIHFCAAFIFYERHELSP